MRLFDLLLVSLITATLLAVIVVFKDDAMPYPVTIPAEADKPASRPWAGIWIHSSGAAKGGLRSLDKAYAARGGAPFHFVIGNGSETQDGEVEESPLWKLQRQGLNPDVIEICLIGVIDREKPTRRQQASLEKLLARLCRERLIPASEICAESERRRVNCPGRFYDAAGTRAAVKASLGK